MSKILCTNQCCGSMTFWCGSGSADPCLWVMDADPSIFIIEKVDHFSKVKSQKEVTKQKSRFFLQFLLKDRRIRIHTSD
jgi:hypothetical protein